MRRRLEKERRRRPLTAGHLWPSSPCQQGMFTTLLPRPHPSCFPRLSEAKGTGSGQRNATAMCEKAQQGEHEELGKITKDYIAAQQLHRQHLPPDPSGG